MADRERMARKWAEFHRLVVPSDASPMQVREMQMCFYAGALVAIKSMTDDISAMPEELGVQELEAMSNEVMSWHMDYNLQRQTERTGKPTTVQQPPPTENKP